ncbi:hypothetical protein V1478_010354 [Vespula squamosa]|uniref:Uncharacterized protein n=1 Tax=Vespula squamosa TaxID=30214 RepID=A0ABD2AHI7_VESSQ
MSKFRFKLRLMSIMHFHCNLNPRQKYFKKFNNDSDNYSDRIQDEPLDSSKKRRRMRFLILEIRDPCPTPIDYDHDRFVLTQHRRLYLLIAYDMTGVYTGTDTCTHIHMRMREYILGPEGKKARSPIDRSRHNVNNYVELFTAKGRKGLERLDIFHCNKV